MGTSQLICRANQLAGSNMMTTLVFNGLSLDIKGLALVVLVSKNKAEFHKINRNSYAGRIPNVLKRVTAAKIAIT